MLTPLRIGLIGLTISTLALAGATGIAAAAGKAGIGGPIPLGKIQTHQAVEVAPTGDGLAGERECERYGSAINSWLDAQVEAVEALDEDAARTADRNAAALQDEATDAGCFIIY